MPSQSKDDAEQATTPKTPIRSTPSIEVTASGSPSTIVIERATTALSLTIDRKEMLDAVTQNSSSEAEKCRIEGLSCFKDKNYIKALEIFERGLKLEPTNPFLLDYKGLALLKLGRFAEALEFIEAAIQNYSRQNPPKQEEPLDKNQIIILHNKASALIFLGQHDLARDICRQVQKVEPNLNMTLHLFADTYFFKREYEAAIEPYKHALTMPPVDATNNDWLKSCFNLGYAYLQTGNFSEARKRFMQILIQKTDNNWSKYYQSLAKYYQGYTHLLEEEFSEALECFETVINSIPVKIELANPENRNSAAIIWHNKAVAYGSLGQHLNALKCFEHAITLNPNHAKAAQGKKMALQALREEVTPGDHKNAAETVETTRVNTGVNKERKTQSTEKGPITIAFIAANAAAATVPVVASGTPSISIGAHYGQ